MCYRFKELYTFFPDRQIIGLHKPACFKNKCEGTTEMLTIRRIATFRIHVERAIERKKNYHILDFIPTTLCKSGLIDMIFFACAVLTNFLPPLV
ncbi:hypothetical protein P5673_014527, partial [Acropora cervicornis]